MAPSGTSTRIQAKGKCKDGHVSEHRQLRKVGRNGEPATKRSAPETPEAPFARSRAPGRPCSRRLCAAVSCGGPGRHLLSSLPGPSWRPSSVGVPRSRKVPDVPGRERPGLRAPLPAPCNWKCDGTRRG